MGRSHPQMIPTCDLSAMGLLLLAPTATSDLSATATRDLSATGLLLLAPTCDLSATELLLLAQLLVDLAAKIRSVRQPWPEREEYGFLRLLFADSFIW